MSHIYVTVPPMPDGVNVCMNKLSWKQKMSRELIFADQNLNILKIMTQMIMNMMPMMGKMNLIGVNMKQITHIMMRMLQMEMMNQWQMMLPRNFCVETMPN